MEEAKAHLKEHGWVKIPSVLTKDDAAHALDRLWKAKQTSEASGEETFRASRIKEHGTTLRSEHFNVIWCLTRMTKENGATLYIPGSNKWTCWDDVPANAPDLLVPFEAEAGDIVVLDGRLWHTSGCNTTKDEDRAILFAYYSAPYMRQLVNWTAKLPQELQETLSPELKELFGLSHIGYVVYGDLRYMADKYPKKLDGESAGKHLAVENRLYPLGYRAFKK
ncbi:MAG: hypothetical protein Q9172_000997 [Xanthocarpia lactea]